MKSTSRVSLQDQLMELSLDIEDKEKICDLLRRKVDKETRSLGKTEDVLSEDFAVQIENEAVAQKKRIDELVEISNKLVAEKASLLAACKSMVESVNEEERNTSAEIRSLHRNADKSLDTEKRLFRASYEDRLQKYLAQKLLEYKESTAKGMQSEFNRLQMIHEAEMAEVDQWLHNEERQLQQSMTARLQQSVDEERAAAKEELRLSLSAIQDKCGAECEQAIRNGARNIRTLQESQERELEKVRAVLGDKAKRLRRSNQTELKQTQDGSQQRIADLKSSHAMHVENIQAEHEQLVRQLKKQAREALSRAESEAELRSSSAAGGARSASRSPSKESTRQLLSPNKQRNSEATTAANGESEFEARVRREAEAQRDKQLQGEIRALEIETFRMERGWKTRAEEEKLRVVEAQTKEETENARRSRHLNEQLADLVLSREQLLRAVQDLKQQEESTSRSVAETRKEIQVYRDGIGAQRHRIQDKEALHKLSLRELQLESASRLRELRERCDALAAASRREEKQCEEDLRRNEQHNTAELAVMDRNVTQDVQRLEQEIRSTKEAVATEASRRAGLLDLVRKYSASAEEGRSQDRRPASFSAARTTSAVELDRGGGSSNRSATSTLSGATKSSRYNTGTRK